MEGETKLEAGASAGIFMDQIFWATLAAFCGFALAVELSLRIIEANEKTPKPQDPYRLERFRNGEPPDPDELP